MAVGFGFSISDLFAGLKLIKDSIEAVNDAKGASADYATLITEIISLQDGLEAVQEVQSDQNISQKQQAAIDRAVAACYSTVEDFLESISKYQPHLHASASGLESSYRKIKWALCKKDDVAKFRAQLGRHSSSIQMLFLTFQAKQNLEANKAGGNSMVKVGGGKESHVTEMLQNLSVEQRQCFIVIMNQNQELMRSVQSLQNMLSMQATVPPQVLLQQPVVLLDPFGRMAPFHLDFIDSSECFMAVLKARFSGAGVTPSGLSKLENHDFLIQDTRRRRSIDLNKNWHSVFRPGQHVEMSMIFHRFACPPSTCPGCLEENEDDEEQVYCQACGLCYQNVQAISRKSRDWGRNLPPGDVRVTGEDIPYIVSQPGKEPELKMFRPAKESEDKLFDGYRRIQVVSQPIDLLDPKFPALQLIEDFCRFSELLKGAPDDMSSYMPDIRDLHDRAVQHILQQRSSFPAFASFTQITQVRSRLTQESLDLRRSIDNLIPKLYNDQDTRTLMQYIKQSYPSNHARNYYTGVLSRITSLSDFNKANSPKAKSTERMQWLMLDSRSK